MSHPVYINGKGQKFTTRGRHTHVHPGLEEFIPQLIEMGDFDGREIVREFVFSEFVGVQDRVEVMPSDEIIYAIRKGRKGHSKFVLNRLGTPTRSITGVFKWDGMLEVYIIITLFFGSKSGLEPYDKRAREKDILFWTDKALVFREADIIKNSEVVQCPWRYRKDAICYLELDSN